eukprot:CAMPEP_0184484654 /NCGR_PEP_ID=MMETSP0113_2-20130426/6347_1 /TAXON_ID=91329 /ORGANISM="Norrisiella sphaerica, Strain BC52" /LENGTH=681 /DNA_ID=CAMNT_0026865741 /DNA_START=67 /DNA_END=2112 /DNA_ORIENTATION=+
MAHHGSTLRLLSCSEDVRIWDILGDSKELKSQFQPQNIAVTSARWGGGGNQLVATASADGHLHINLSSGKLMTDLTPSRISSHIIRALSFSSRSRYLCSAGDSKAVEVWDLQKKCLLRLLEGHKANVKCIDFGRTDMLIASGAADGRILLHNVHHNTISELPCSSFRKTSEAATSICFSTLKKALVGSTFDTGHVRIWDTNVSKAVVSFKKHTAPATGIAFSKKHRSLICSSGLDQTLRFSDISKGTEINVTQCPEPLTCIDFREDGASVAVGTMQGKILVYDLRKIIKHKSPACVFQGHSSEVVSVQFATISRQKFKSQLSILEDPSISQPHAKSSGNTKAKISKHKFAGSSSTGGSSGLNLSIDPNSSLLNASGAVNRLTSPGTIGSAEIKSTGRHRVNLSMDITSPSSMKDHLPGHGGLDASFDTAAMSPKTYNSRVSSQENLRNRPVTPDTHSNGTGLEEKAGIPSSHGAGKGPNLNGAGPFSKEAWTLPASGPSLKRPSSSHSHKSHKSRFSSVPVVEEEEGEVGSPEKKSLKTSFKTGSATGSNAPTHPDHANTSSRNHPAHLRSPPLSRTMHTRHREADKNQKSESSIDSVLKQTTLRPDDKQTASALHSELIKSTVEEMVGQMKDELHEEISGVHLEMLRQFHVQQEMFRSTVGALTKQIMELKAEVKALREF